MIKTAQATIYFNHVTQINKSKNSSDLNRQFMPTSAKNFKTSTQSANRHSDDIRVLY